MKTFILRLFAVVLIIGLVITAVLLVRHRKIQLTNMAMPRERRLPVALKTVNHGQSALTRYYIGTIEPVVEAVLSAQTTGYLTAVHKNEGDRLIKGEVVAEIDPRLAVARKKALEAELAGAREDLATKETIRNRRRKLVKDQVVSKEALDEIELGTALSAAHVRRLEQDMSAAEVALSFAHVNSFFDGMVVDRMRNVGDLVTQGTPIMRVENTGRGYRVLVHVSQEIAARLFEKAPAKLIQGGRTIDAVVDRVHPSISNGNLATVEIRIPERPFNLPTYGSVGVELTIAILEGWVVAADCILETDADFWVFAVSDDMKVTPIPVSVQGWNGSHAVISGPLQNDMALASGPESMLLVLSRNARIIPGTGDAS